MIREILELAMLTTFLAGLYLTVLATTERHAYSHIAPVERHITLR